MNGQSRVQSFIESLLNIAVGYMVAVGAQYIIFPWFGIHISHGAHYQIAAFFTVVSIVRSYVLRRIFNAIHIAQENRRHKYGYARRGYSE